MNMQTDNPNARWRPSALIGASFLLHGAALAAVAIRPAWWPQVLAAIVANHLLLTVCGLVPRSRWLGPNVTRLPAKAAARGEIAITIDDGPDPVVTPAVLYVLDSYKARATFFCIGERALRHPELCREIVRRGHTIENHSQHHRFGFSFMGMGALRRELAQAQETIAGLIGRRPAFFRAPAGLRNPLLDPILAGLGLRLASWTRRGFDTRTSNPDVLVRRLTKGLRAGDILLLHDGNAACLEDGEPAIYQVLPLVLEHVRNAGLHSVTLDEAHR